jgi:hypothetical protein
MQFYRNVLKYYVPSSFPYTNFNIILRYGLRTVREDDATRWNWTSKTNAAPLVVSGVGKEENVSRKEKWQTPD